MRNRAIVVSLLSLPFWAGTAMADMKAAPEPTPTFTPAETQIIARNQLLGAIVADDPWLVRRMLDRLAGKVEHATPVDRAGSPPPAGFDAARNPDLAESERGSPEANYDLLQLIKKAAGEKQK